jgi:ABC-type Fe3+-hydroxamate transport system substrate-binding protein
MGLRLIRDMMGRELHVPEIPQRIVSIVPSQTELLFDLGLEKEVVGITKFCVHPHEWHKNKTRIGGTKKLHIDKIIALRPDLIIANKEENTQAEIEQLAEQFPVWISDIKTIKDALRMIEDLGILVDKKEIALTLSKEISSGFNQLLQDTKALRVAYFIWRKPWMTVGSDTFIHDMIKRIGWQNVYASHLRYPETNLDELKSLNP